MSHFTPMPGFEPVIRHLEMGSAGLLRRVYVMRPGFYDFLLTAMDKTHCFRFDFGEWSVADSHHMVQFSYDCIANGSFVMPFDSVFMTWPDSPYHVDSRGFRPEEAINQTAAALHITLSRGGVPTEFGFVIAEHFREDGRQVPNQILRALVTHTCIMSVGLVIANYGEGPEAMMQDLSLVQCYESGKQVVSQKGAIIPQEHCMGIGIYTNEAATLLLNRGIDMGRDGGVTFRNMAYLIGTLSAKDATVRATATPEPRILAKRQREGRRPWVSYSTIKLNTQRFVSQHGTGHHASPAMHWRRGHQRHLSSGKIVPVCPCLVGASEFGKVISNYVMEKVK